MKEQYLELFLRKNRISKVLPYLILYKNVICLTLGVGGMLCY